MFSQKGKFFIEKRLMSTGDSKNWESVFKIELVVTITFVQELAIIAQGDWILSRNINFKFGIFNLFINNRSVKDLVKCFFKFATPAAAKSKC